MIAIIDYNAGNLRSVEKALKFLSQDVCVTSDKGKIEDANAIILPGVGAFEDCINSLREKNLDTIIKAEIEKGKPFLGICLGFQMLFEYSEESKRVGENVEGLNLFKGGVKRFSPDMGLKIPHMGWNAIEVLNESTTLDSIGENPFVYFVHSYYVDSENPSVVAAKTNYGIKFDAAIEKDNVFACQFHPEKSGETGLNILRRFIKVI